jgi:hypothetical protein
MVSFSLFLPKSAERKEKVISVDSQTQPKVVPLNICMRLHEIDSRYKAFEVSANIPGIGVFRTLIYAETTTDAQRAAEHLYGRQRVSAVRRYVPEQTAAKSPEQQRIKSLTDQAKRLRAQAQQERAKLAMKKVQQTKTPTIKPIKPITAR